MILDSGDESRSATRNWKIKLVKRDGNTRFHKMAKNGRNYLALFDLQILLTQKCLWSQEERQDDKKMTNIDNSYLFPLICSCYERGLDYVASRWKDVLIHVCRGYMLILSMLTMGSCLGTKILTFLISLREGVI